MIEGNIKELEFKFIGKLDWIKLRDFIVIKLQECKTEENFNFILKAMIGSMFRNIEEIDKARKALHLEHISEHDRKVIKELTEKNEN